MSKTGLMFQIDQTERPRQLDQEVAFFVVQSCTADIGDSLIAVNDVTLTIFFNESCVAGLLDPFGDFIDCPFPGLFFELGSSGSDSTLLNAWDCLRIVVLKKRPGAAGAAINRVVWPFNI
jgi:hypothetical protein